MMGHYRVDMACDICGEMRCACPPAPEKPNKNFIVTDDYRVVTVDEFDAECVQLGRYPMLERMGKTEFKKRADAEVHARELCEAAVEHARTALTQLKNICKVQRPWEKK